MDDLLVVQGQLTPLSSKTHIVYQFHLAESSDCLVIDFQYSPKSLDDLQVSRPLIMEAIDQYAFDPSVAEMQKKHWERFAPLHNLLTLSIDDPSGFRGSAHRHPNKQRHILTEAHASPGFIAGPLPEGVWRMTISAHCIVTTTCTYCLTVKKGMGAHEMGAI